MSNDQQHDYSQHYSRFHDLSFPCHFVVWAIRIWLRASCQSPELFGVLREAFDVLELPEAGRTLDKGMSILSVGTDKDLMFFGPDNEDLSRDECDFLRVIEFFQAEAPKNAEAVLDTWLPLAGTRTAGAIFNEYAGLLSRGGLNLLKSPKRKNRDPIFMSLGHSIRSSIH